MKVFVKRSAMALCLAVNAVLASHALAEDAVGPIIFTNVNVFDGVHEELIENTNVVVTGNLITKVSTEPLAVAGGKVIDGGGRTLMPGLTDAHWHVMHAHIASMQIFVNDIGYLTLAGAESAEATLMRGFTTVRDMGGPVFGIKKMGYPD